MLYRNGDYATATQLALVALKEQEQLHDAQGMLATLRTLFDIQLPQRKDIEALEYSERLLVLALKFNFSVEIAEAYFCSANVARRLRRFNQAREYASKAFQRFEEMGNQPFLAAVLYEQSMIEFRDNNAMLAKKLAEASFDLMTLLSDDFNRVYCLLHLGDIELKLNNPSDAEQRWEQGVTLALSIRHPALKYLLGRLGREGGIIETLPAISA